MGEGDENPFVLGRRQHVAHVEHFLEVIGVHRGVAGHDAVEIFHLLIGEEQRGHPGAAVDHRLDARRLDIGFKTIGQAFGPRGDDVVGFRMGLQVAQGVEPHVHRDRIARQRAGLVDRAVRREHRHDFSRAAESAHRHAAADDFADGGQIRFDAEKFLGSAVGDAEAGDDFVEDEQRAFFAGDFPQAFQKARVRRHDAHVPGHRFDDDAGDFAFIFGEQRLHRFEVVVGGDEGVLRGALRHAGARRFAEGQSARPGFHEQGIGVAMVAAFEFDELFPAGVAAGQADRRHRRFCAGVDHPKLIGTRKSVDEGFGHFHFDFRRQAKGRALGQRLVHILVVNIRRVAENQRPPRADVIGVGILVRVRDLGALAVVREHRRDADVFKGAHRRVDPAGNDLFRARVQLF